MTPLHAAERRLIAALSAEIERLHDRGARSRRALVQLAERGDWRRRALAASALGRLVRQDRAAWTSASLSGLLARVPGIRRRVASVGRHGRLVSRSLVNVAGDRLFIVRLAAVLALGECRDPELAPVLRELLADPFAPVRVAARAALHAIGVTDATASASAPLERTPDVVAEGASTAAWLDLFAVAHAALLSGLPPDERDLAGRADRDGPALHPVVQGGVSAEAARYDGEVDLSYQLAKPFGHADRSENLRQLDALVALLAHLDLAPGARVVDLGGGTGWVAEFLARFGFRPIVLDVSTPLLRLGQMRAAAAPHVIHMVAGDMAALPLTASSIDAVIVIDALHHVTDLTPVLAEVRRVLVPGGRFLIAEPGEGHSESPKSLAETREHGVRESEIHPQVVWTLAAQAGFTSGVILPRTPATTALQVQYLPAAMRARSADWLVHDGDTVTRFDTLVLRSLLARPLMVLTAGHRQPDSSAPGELRAVIRATLVRTGAIVRGAIEVRNSGDTRWLAAPHDAMARGTVSIGLQLLSPSAAMLDRELWRRAIPASMAPGETLTIDVTCPLPSATDAYRLKVDLVAEGVCWFEDRGSRPIDISV